MDWLPTPISINVSFWFYLLLLHRQQMLQFTKLPASYVYADRVWCGNKMCQHRLRIGFLILFNESTLLSSKYEKNILYHLNRSFCKETLFIMLYNMSICVQQRWFIELILTLSSDAVCMFNNETSITFFFCSDSMEQYVSHYFCIQLQNMIIKETGFWRWYT